MVYDYEQVRHDVNRIAETYPFVEVHTVGKSVRGRDLIAVKLGIGEREVFWNGTHHGMEWLTAKLLTRFAADYAAAYRSGRRIRGHDIRQVYERYTIWLLPMVNPDGVEIAKTKRWQSNARGVDLNHNYNAGFWRAKEMEAAYGADRPGPTRYGGSYPESEPESRAVADLTRAHTFLYVIALHSQGEVIYWDYRGRGNREMAERLAEMTGYQVDMPEGIGIYGGYKDWFIKEFNRPGFTVEVGKGQNPLPLEDFEKIYEKVLEIFIPIE